LIIAVNTSRAATGEKMRVEGLGSRTLYPLDGSEPVPVRPDDWTLTFAPLEVKVFCSRRWGPPI
jgi:hypothetical protein